MPMNSHFLKKTVCLVAASAILLPSARAENGWVDLCNGTNLDGWIEHSGQAKYSVTNGVLVGESVAGSANSFLCTRRTYRNFELELEYKCDALLNSGVQIRSEVFPQATNQTWLGKTYTWPADRIHGYQCEIDMDTQRNRLWTGGIYDEARRGWLKPAGGEKGIDGQAFTRQGQRLSRPGEWNQLRIVADGPVIKTWLNGELRTELTDTLTEQGVIGLQIHGVGTDSHKVGLQAAFRHLRIHELPDRSPMAEASPNTLTEQEKAAGWHLLWDGHSASGWRSLREDKFPT
ncbi:MAG TPA: DUF1080 domain-containing protein, partial [Verrucomicrobiae bacterium]